jgi:arylformamidase
MRKKERIIDISWPLTKDSTSYKNRSFFNIFPIKMFNPDHVRETKITLSSHTGTHVDAPSHFIEDGRTIDQQPLSNLIGKAKVLDLTNVSSSIKATDLQKHQFKKDQIILIKTKNSLHNEDDVFDKQFIYLTPSAAKYLKQKKIKAVGFDYLGIERDDNMHSTHKILLYANIPIIEGLRLNLTKQKEYYFVCLPLAFPELDAAPARAILIENHI